MTLNELNNVNTAWSWNELLLITLMDETEFDKTRQEP